MVGRPRGRQQHSFRFFHLFFHPAQLLVRMAVSVAALRERHKGGRRGAREGATLTGRQRRTCVNRAGMSWERSLPASPSFDNNVGTCGCCCALAGAAGRGRPLGRRPSAGRRLNFARGASCTPTWAPASCSKHVEQAGQGWVGRLPAGAARRRRHGQVDRSGPTHARQLAPLLSHL